MFSGISVFAYDELPEEVKIGLYYGSTALYEPNISCDGFVTVKLLDEEVAWGQNLKILTEEGVTNIYNDEGLIYSYDGTENLTYHPTEEGYIRINGKEYRGFLITIKLDSGAYTIVNQVNTEEYLYSVVSKEMSPSFPKEALKAQAVCARTYAMNSIGNFKSQGFDMTNDQYSQVYGGISAEDERTTIAVDETKGMVVTYNDKPAQVYYFSTSSGVTLNSKDVWLADLPYLTSVEDTYQDDVKPDKMAWEVTFTKERLKEILTSREVKIGDITGLLAEFNQQGAVSKLTFVGTDGEKSYTKESTRNVLGLKSQVYTITNNYDKKDVNNKKVYALTAKGTEEIKGEIWTFASKQDKKVANYSVISASGVESIKNDYEGLIPVSYTLKGTGWGHGVGLSQYGAVGMAEAGFYYDEILTHYFSGTIIK